MSQFFYGRPTIRMSQITQPGRSILCVTYGCRRRISEICTLLGLYTDQISYCTA